MLKTWVDWSNKALNEPVTIPDTYDFACFDSRLLFGSYEVGAPVGGNIVTAARKVAYVWVLHSPAHDTVSSFPWLREWVEVTHKHGAIMQGLDPRWNPADHGGTGPPLYWVDPTRIPPQAYVTMIAREVKRNGIAGLFLDFLYALHPTVPQRARLWQIELVKELRQALPNTMLIANGPWPHDSELWSLGLDGVFIEKMGAPWSYSPQELARVLKMPYAWHWIDTRPNHIATTPEAAAYIAEFLATYAYRNGVVAEWKS